HSSYVLNKLGLEQLVLLNDSGGQRITDLSPGTQDYFRKLPGFDTLRLVLAKRAILVEGPSDELIVQRAYRDTHGVLPIQDGVDVISVGLSIKRFLELAVHLKRQTAAVRDNDHKDPETVKAAYAEFTVHDFISVHVGADPALNTLEPQLLAANDRKK